MQNFQTSQEYLEFVACSTYLHSLLNYHVPAHSLCSFNTSLLSVPRVHTTFTSRGFSVAAPSVWNSLPTGIHTCSTSHIFRRRVLSRPSVPPSGPLVAHTSAPDLAFD